MHHLIIIIVIPMISSPSRMLFSKPLHVQHFFHQWVTLGIQTQVPTQTPCYINMPIKLKLVRKCMTLYELIPKLLNPIQNSYA